MKRNCVAGIILGIALLLVIAVPIISAERKTGEDEFKALKDDIQICNLLTGLYLTPEQVVQLTPLAEKAGRLREDFFSRREYFAKSNVALLTTMKKEILETGDASKQTRNRHKRAKDAYDKAEDQFKHDMKELNREAQGILTENQKIVVAEYKSCLIPLKSISDPERIGSAGNNEMVIRVLTRARMVARDKYPEMKKQFLSRITPRLEKHFSEKEIPSEIAAISQVMDQARAMSDEEFELKKNDLASKVKPRHVEGSEKDLERKIDRFLLNPRFPDVAQAKLRIDRKEASLSRKKALENGQIKDQKTTSPDR